MGEVAPDMDPGEPSVPPGTDDGPPAPAGGPSTVEQLLAPAVAMGGFLNRRALVRATRAVPRTLHFVGNALWRGEVAESLPAPHLSIGLAAQVAMDEALLAIAMAPNRFPLPGDYGRVADELAGAEALFRDRGWVDDPASYHREPPALTDTDLTTSRGWALGQGYDRVSWDSGFTPHEGEPGSERWLGFGPNATATAALFRHPDPTRPWVVGVHGFCMGYPFMDFPGLHAPRLHHDLGMNVALPALPLHGPRRVTRVSGEPFLSFELMNAVHGLTQAVWDLRRLIGWIRSQGGTSISLFGVSLGGYTASLLAGHRARSRRGAWPASPWPTSPACSTTTARATSGCGRSSTGSWAAPPSASTAWCRRSASTRWWPRTVATSSPATATAWPPPDQARRLAEHWGTRRCRGTRGTTSATSGRARSPSSSRRRWPRRAASSPRPVAVA